MPNHLTRGLPNDCRETNKYSTEAAYRDGHKEKRLSETLPNADQEMPKSAYAMYKVAFRVQERTPIAVSMTTYCEAHVLDMVQ
jgi:hypothetical protein